MAVAVAARRGYSRLMTPKLRFIAPMLAFLACGGPAGSPPGDDSPADSASEILEGDPATIPLAGLCPSDTRWGAFSVEAYDAYAIVAGSVADGVLPISVLTEVTSEGNCQLLRRENPYCSPSCESGQTCDLDGVCVPYPEGQDLGTVSVLGLLDAVSMEPSTPGYTYSSDTLPFPPFEAGGLVALQSSGGNHDPLLLHGVGVDLLEPTDTSWELAGAVPLSLAWDAPAGSVRSEVALNMNIDQHGITPIFLRCAFADTGSATVPASVIDAMLAAGVSGFPSASLARRTVDRTAVGEGCVDFTVSHDVLIDLSVDGHTPCESNADCPIGHPCDTETQTCL